MSRLLIVIVLAACTRTSDKYCGLHPEDLAHCAPQDAARQRCTSDPECMSTGSPHCLLEGAAGVCVGCIDDTQCTTAGRLSCDPETHSCRSCVEHSDCATSNACLEDGTCGTDDTVLYVDEAGVDTGTCSLSAKCKTITYALGRVTATRFHIKLSGRLVETVTIASKRVTLIADKAAKLVGVATPAIKIQKATVHVLDLEIACESPINGIKSEMESTSVLRDVYIHGCGLGIENKSGFLNVSRSRIADNAGGGISLDAASAFSITNTLVYRNGTPASTKGGVTIAATTTGMNRFEHNTVAGNQVKEAAGAAGGVACTITNFMEMPNNIIAGNMPSNTFGTCSSTKSRVEADAAQFLFTPDYHLSAGSPAIDQVDSALDDDVDGQFRPQGARSDYGADEYKP